MSKNPPLFGITGYKNSGKTTLVERLVAELIAMGKTVSTIKHAHHAFDIDHEGTDSFRHRQAGATEVAIVGGNRWALMHELRDEAEPDLAHIVARLAPADVVLVEGYKFDDHPKLVLITKQEHMELLEKAGNVVAVATNDDMVGIDVSIPKMARDDVREIASFIIDHLASGENAK